MKNVVDRLVRLYGQKDFVLRKRGAMPAESWKNEPVNAIDEAIKAVFVPMQKKDAAQYYSDAINSVAEIYTTAKNVDVNDTVVKDNTNEYVVLEVSENYKADTYLYTKVVIGRHDG